MLLGLALGDSWRHLDGSGQVESVLTAGVCTQLACFTVEGLIRASVRASHKGICYPPDVIWHATCRWATIQGIEPDRLRKLWAFGAWADGWLVTEPLLSRRRGSAPATVRALHTPEAPGRPGHAVTFSSGSHAVTRTLPLGAYAVANERAQVVELVTDVAAQTHGAPRAQAAAATAALILGRCLAGLPLREAVAWASHADSTGRHLVPAKDLGLAAVMAAADNSPGDVSRLAAFAPDASAVAALRGGVFAAASFPELDQVHATLDFAARSPVGNSVACVTGALVGAMHGLSSLPSEILKRLELVWIVDALARDLFLELTDSPGGSEWTEPRDPLWWSRYPGR